MNHKDHNLWTHEAKSSKLGPVAMKRLAWNQKRLGLKTSFQRVWDAE